MKLDQYQWSHNPRGIHNTQAFLKINHARYVQAHLGWIKLVAGGNEYLGDIAQLNANGVTPIIRLYNPKFGTSPVPPGQIELVRQYIQAGARWFEFYNEPNLQFEWPDDQHPDYNDQAGSVAPMMDHWLQWAEQVIQMGGYPAFPALSETVGHSDDVTSWINVLMRYLAKTYYDRFRAVADNGLWVATHPYFYNHFYQEAGHPKVPRQPDDENGAEGGWHFEYPYDPITQSDDPGRSVLGASASAPNGDPIGLAGMGYAFMQRFKELFGGVGVPVIGTEGGITPVPVRGSLTQLDARFPGYNWRSHGEATLACFNWIATQAPPWMFGLALWKENDYWGDPDSEGKGAKEQLAAVQRLTDAPPVLKTVPSLAVLDGVGSAALITPTVPGPGPMHGTPDFHCLFMSADLNPDWFFDSAHVYWDRYQPALLTTLDLLGQFPANKSLAITLITTPVQRLALLKTIEDHAPNVFIDVITADSAEAIAAAFQLRVANGKRFQ